MGTGRRRRLRRYLRRIWSWTKPIVGGVLIATVVAGILYGIVKIEERITSVKPSGENLIRAIGDSKLLGAVETISIITALVLFWKEGKRRSHYEAWQVIDSAQDETSYARIRALEDLASDWVSLRGLDAKNADLRGIDLEEANLQEANLESAILTKANLQEANLQEVNLKNSNLQEANLIGANLISALLQEAQLDNANLREANLVGAKLSGAILEGADLREANLMEADLKGVKFAGVQLSGANLRGAKFYEPISLNPEEVKKGYGWQQAEYSDEFRKKLGLF